MSKIWSPDHEPPAWLQSLCYWAFILTLAAIPTGLWLGIAYLIKGLS